MCYFYGNGALTWLFSPLNLLVDIICLPFINKQVYKLEDFPQDYQNEINAITVECDAVAMLEAMKDQLAEHERTMLLYKWYGHNVGDAASQPRFHDDFKYILTIGLSVFNKQEQTKQHFGWLRAGIRVLYNIDPDIPEHGAYINVNDIRHNWKTDGRLFIFDDTVQHQSFNMTDIPRHCLFIDIVRPALFPIIITSIVKALGSISLAIPAVTRQSGWKRIN
jgi:beta-hydroxylase